MTMMKPSIASAARLTIMRTSIVSANRPAIAYFSSNQKLQKLPIDYLEEARKKMDAADVSAHQTMATRTVHNGIGRRKLQKLPIDYINEAREKLNMPVRSFSTSAYDGAEPTSHSSSQVRSASSSPEVTTYGKSAGKKMHKLAIDYLNDAREKRLAEESKNNAAGSARSFSTVASSPIDTTTTAASSNPDVVNYGSSAGKKMQKLAIDYLNDAREKRLAEETKGSNEPSATAQQSK